MPPTAARGFFEATTAVVARRPPIVLAPEEHTYASGVVQSTLDYVVAHPRLAAVVSCVCVMGHLPVSPRRHIRCRLGALTEDDAVTLRDTCPRASPRTLPLPPGALDQ